MRAFSMFRNYSDQVRYIMENYPEVTDSRIDDDHWDLPCTHCKITRGFQVIERAVQHHRSGYSGTGGQDFNSPVTYWFRCPVCKAYKQWIVYRLAFQGKKPEDGSEAKTIFRYFRVTSVPSEGLEEIEELPNEPSALRTAYRQAVRAMDANAHLAAAAMFRRAVQVITRDLLGAKPGTLASELHDVIGKTYNGVTLTSSFATSGYIIKEAGNQGAHPDKDPDLLEFAPQDAQDLQSIFMELVSELFIAPAATKKAREDFMARRKISAPPGPKPS
jgi:hypothetical protein